MSLYFRIKYILLRPIVNWWIWRFKKIPIINNRFVCVCDRGNKKLTALVSSRINKPGYYLPLFLFPKVLYPREEGNLFENDNYISQAIGEDAKIYINNTIIKMGGCETMLLVGLSENQKSYFKTKDYNIVEINNISDIDNILGLDARSEFRCREDDLEKGLFIAGKHKKKLVIDNEASEIAFNKRKNCGILVVENNDDAETIIGINYAISIEADLRIVEKMKSDEETEIQTLIQDWKEDLDGAALQCILIRLEKRIDKSEYNSYKYATFFTGGLPYSLLIDNSIPCSYVNLMLRPDIFVLNAILGEHEHIWGSAVVFSPQDFKDEETQFVIDFFNQNNFETRTLLGKDATVRNLDFNLQHFPYDFFHICSHGGEVKGCLVVEDFMDRGGIKHTIEYYEVVGFSPLPGKDLIEVHRKTIFKKIDGFKWKSAELKEQKYPSYIFEDMRKKMYASVKTDKDVRRTRIGLIPSSCSIKCSDSIHQGMFRSLASNSSPIIF